MGQRYRSLAISFFCVTLLSCTKEEPEVLINAPVSNASEPVTDIDGNTYRTVRIGDQVWMAENLRTGRYADGTTIPQVQTSSWASASSGAWCVNPDEVNFEADCGRLYNYFAVADPRKLCPQGWRTPTDQDWMDLELSLGMSMADVDMQDWRGGEANAGGQLKSRSDLWTSVSLGTCDYWGFSAQPGGHRNSSGSFVNWGGYAEFWTSTYQSGTFAYARRLYYFHERMWRGTMDRKTGMCVRCIQEL